MLQQGLYSGPEIWVDTQIHPQDSILGGSPPAPISFSVVVSSPASYGTANASTAARTHLHHAPLRAPASTPPHFRTGIRYACLDPRSCIVDASNRAEDVLLVLSPPSVRQRAPSLPPVEEPHGPSLLWWRDCELWRPDLRRTVSAPSLAMVTEREEKEEGGRVSLTGMSYVSVTMGRNLGPSFRCYCWSGSISLRQQKLVALIWGYCRSFALN